MSPTHTKGETSRNVDLCEDYSRRLWAKRWVCSLTLSSVNEMSDSWFHTFALFRMLYSFFWVIFRHVKRKNSSCLHRLWRWNRQSVPKRRNTKFKGRGTTRRKEYKEILDITLLTYSLHGAESFLGSYLVLQLVKKFPVLYGTRKFITVFTSARHLSLSWANSIQSPPLPLPEDPS